SNRRSQLLSMRTSFRQVSPNSLLPSIMIVHSTAIALSPIKTILMDCSSLTAHVRPQRNYRSPTLRLAADTRRAWIDAVAAWERVAYLNRAQAAADSASALAEKLGQTGAFTKTGQAREHVFYAELAGQTAEARLQARMAKEALTRLMGLW